MAAPAAAHAQYAEQARLAEAAVRAVSLLWAELDPHNVSGSWEANRVGERIYRALVAVQILAAGSADSYADLILAAQGVTPAVEGKVVPEALAGIASDGRDLATLLLQPVVTTAVARAGGVAAPEAMSAGLSSLVRIVGTQVVDAGRAAQSITRVTRGDGIGFVRMLSPGACGRCAILAGRWYRWDAGFDRHPLCKCFGIPAAEDTLDEPLTDPDAYFRSLSRDEQDKAFTKAGAQAVRDGADIGQVVNARRGALGLSSPGRLTAAEQRMLRGGKDFGHLARTDVYGRPLSITTEGVTVRGTAGRRLIDLTGAASTRYGSVTRTVAKAPRLMPEAIYELARDRADAVRLLHRFGYLY